MWSISFFSYSIFNIMRNIIKQKGVIMATYALVIIAIVIVIWFYSIYSILTSKFENAEEKKNSGLLA